MLQSKVLLSHELPLLPWLERVMNAYHILYIYFRESAKKESGVDILQLFKCVRSHAHYTVLGYVKQKESLAVRSYCSRVMHYT